MTAHISIAICGSEQVPPAQLEKAGINHHYTESTGGHTWANWRIYLNEFAPSLFK